MATVRLVEWETGKTWQVNYTDANGKRRKKNFKRQKDAETFRKKVEREVDDGVHVADRDSVTIEEAVKIWLEAVEVGRNGRPPAEASTLRGYKNRARHIVEFLGQVRLNRLTTPMVADFRDKLLKSGRSRAMTRLVLVALGGVISECQNRGLIIANPASAVKIVTPGRHRQKVRIPEKSEVRSLIETAEAWVDSPPPHFAGSRPRDPDARAVFDAQTRNRMVWFSLFVRTLIFTGCRVSEVLGLPWSNVDLKDEVITIEQRLGDGGKIGPVKSEAGRRRIPIPEELRRALAEWKLACPKGPLDLVFPNGQGRPESLTNTYRRLWFPLQRAAKIVEEVVEVEDEGDEPEAVGPSPTSAATVGADGKKMKPKYGLHALRHFRASVLIEAGADVKDVQAELGHASVQLTLDTYTHLFADHVERSRKRAQQIATDLLAPRRK